MIGNPAKITTELILSQSHYCTEPPSPPPVTSDSTHTPPLLFAASSTLLSRRQHTALTNGLFPLPLFVAPPPPLFVAPPGLLPLLLPDGRASFAASSMHCIRGRGRPWWYTKTSLLSEPQAMKGP